jgi:hypothetical protein
MSNWCPPDDVLSHGVLAHGNVVRAPITDDFANAEIVEAMLHAKLRNEFSAVQPDVHFRTWLDRGELRGPAGEYHGHGYRLNFSVKPEISKQLRSVMEAQPNTFQGLELWYAPWTDEPPNT